MTATATTSGHGRSLCGALKKNGEPCERPAGWGTSHPGAGTCKFHLGATERHSRAAHRKLAEEQARASLAEVGVEPIDNPLDALAELAAEAWALKGHFADVVGQLRDQYRFTDEKGAEHLDARVALYERAMDRCQRFLSDWVRLGFEERKVRLDEARAELVATVLQGVLGALGLRPDEPRVLGVLDEWLPVLDGAPPPAIETRVEEG